MGYPNCVLKVGILESRFIYGKVSPELEFTSLVRVLPTGGMVVRVGTGWEGTKMKHQVWTKVVVTCCAVGPVWCPRNCDMSSFYKEKSDKQEKSNKRAKTP